MVGNPLFIGRLQGQILGRDGSRSLKFEGRAEAMVCRPGDGEAVGATGGSVLGSWETKLRASLAWYRLAESKS